MKFIPATNSDKEYFRTLNQLCYEQVVSQQFGAWDELHQNEKFESKWPDNRFRKIFVGQDLVGGVWIDEHPSKIQLREIQIHPTFQNRGIGQKVVEHEIEYASKVDKVLMLRVLFKNPAVSLYKRLGFQIIDQTESQYIMQRSISHTKQDNLNLRR